MLGHSDEPTNEEPEPTILPQESDMCLPKTSSQMQNPMSLLAPECDPNELGTDQKYLLEMCQEITTGQCSTDLGNRKPGPMCHSRWLTTANWILQLYISKENPDKHLVTLVNCIVKVYAPRPI